MISGRLCTRCLPDRPDPPPFLDLPRCRCCWRRRPWHWQWPPVPCTVPDATAARWLEVRVHYPQARLQALPSKAVFTLALCYTQGCPSADMMWDQSIPGAPYDPRLTIFQDDYVGGDLFVKAIELGAGAGVDAGAEARGPDVFPDVFVTIYAAYHEGGNIFATCAVKDHCNTTSLDPLSNACVHVGMPYRSARQNTGGARALVVAYPYFGMAQGTVSTLLPGLHSPQLHNKRDVSVYVPASLAQNPLARAVNVLVINDGTGYFLRQLAFVGGMDHAVLTGAAPETIMIGLPQNGTGCQRQFELTFSVTSAPTPCASGGTDLYLEFVRATVVPAVVAALGVAVGEVSMAGASFGGLTACYAAYALPLYFQRALCQSPSFWWNYGQLARLVSGADTDATRWAASGTRVAEAVVAYIGTTEMSVPLCVDAACTRDISWFTHVNRTVAAFRAAGVNTHFFTLAGGQHAASAWATTFGQGVTMMFTSNFPAQFQMQHSTTSAIRVLTSGSTSAGYISTSAPAAVATASATTAGGGEGCACATCPAAGGGEDAADGIEIGTLVLVVFVAAGLAASCGVHVHCRRRADKGGAGGRQPQRPLHSVAATNPEYASEA